MDYVVSLITVAVMSHLVLGNNCIYQVCDCVGTDILCYYRSLNAIPPKLFNKNVSLTTLNFDANQITTIPAGSLPGNLSVFIMTNNPIKTIDNTAFDESIYTLQDLSFSGANFTQFPEAVYHLKALQTLQISDTNILVWNENGMDQLGPTMKTLSLTSVGLKSWPSWMTSMTNLTELTISACNISIIPDDALDLVANSLTSLDFSKIGLTKLPKSLSKFTVLRTLTLNDNKIIDVTWLPQLSPITSLYLENNKITDASKLSNVLSFFGNTLNSFEIENNSLTSIPEVSFFTQIPFINFESNNISDANSGSLPFNLTGLDLDNNLLVSIPRIINNLTLLSLLSLQANNIQIIQGSQIPISVTDLDLSFNLLSDLTGSSFPENSSLIFLTLNNNPLSRISPDAFNNIPYLSQLTLQTTELTRLPLALASLTKLYIFDVSNSKSLVCTCQQQSLRPWIKSVGPYGIIGTCGVTSIYYFFDVLSQDCPQTL